MLRNLFIILVVFILCLSGNMVHAENQDNAIDLSIISKLNCALTMTNDYVSDTFMMHDVAEDKEQCLQKCQDFAQSSLLSMLDAVEKLEWACHLEKEEFYRFDEVHKTQIEK
jgi:hypothetical protein